jgi:hypothetical protein
MASRHFEACGSKQPSTAIPSLSWRRCDFDFPKSERVQQGAKAASGAGQHLRTATAQRNGPTTEQTKSFDKPVVKGEEGWMEQFGPPRRQKMEMAGYG